ncbi:possible porin [Prochlorococcus marinus str. MIT 9515]|uniref:Possible porin n=1 Tax=Prochlorococcus marinus (strain MIT 9515) TaxID=167542 RepID=A2BXA8_PROM5|nr:carbohydrate porin [Prochlorococcus marinus]ABM72419.1 possible porin [Prochlorococcus marinus str. MIT 9515]
MKLFKSLLVAPAALGLLAPMSVTANEINLTDVSGYTSTKEVKGISDFNPANELAVTNSRVDGLEARFNNFEAGSFSETTTASFSADFEIGSEDGSTTSEAVQAYYGFQIDLNTSFTGEDSFDVSIDAGNAGGSEFDLNSTSDALNIDGISYTFPLGDKTTVVVGDNIDGSTLYNTACVYGGPSNNLDDCGNGNSAMTEGAGTAAGASYDIGNGFTVAVGYTGAGSSTSGIATKEGSDVFGGQLSYAADSYGASVTYAKTDDYSGDDDRNFLGLNGYWTPSDTGAVPSISAGYEVGTGEGLADTTQWFVGLQWDEMGPGTLGTAVGTIGSSIGDVYDPEFLMYEAFYSYEINDGMSITPLVYIKETAAGSDDKTGIMVKTSFSF